MNNSSPSKNVILIKSQDFACRVVKAQKYLVEEKHERRMSDQLCRSGTSIAANVSEAQYAQSKADFIAKMQIALKEANESKNWLEILYRTDYIDKVVFESIYADIIEIIRLLTSILNSAKKKC